MVALLSPRFSAFKAPSKCHVLNFQVDLLSLMVLLPHQIWRFVPALVIELQREGFTGIRPAA